MITKLRYGNTNTFFIEGTSGGLLIDTDYAGALPAFFKAAKAAGIDVQRISYLLMTHYHPDHMGIAAELQTLGVQLLVIDVQQSSIHFADGIFKRDKRLQYRSIDEAKMKIITCAESRAFLATLGINGEIIHTPSHSEDSITIVLDSGDAFVGDLEPLSYLAAYEENPELKRDWERVLSHHPRKIYYGHVNEVEL